MHFDMSSDYPQHSESQQSIGHQLIATVCSLVPEQFPDSDSCLRVCDLACGPGGLTIDLLASLQKIRTGPISMAGLDLTAENIERLERTSSGQIQGIEGSFYQFPAAVGERDIFFSNEGLHWQPPYGMEAAIYSHLSGRQYSEYERWALENLRIAISNIYNALSENGIAVLQFGHEGQLHQLWAVVDRLLDEASFVEKKPLVSFPLFYPKVEQIRELLEKVGFESSSVQIESFQEDLVEDSAHSITEFFKAFTESQFQKIFGEETAERFYSRLREKLESMELAEFTRFREKQWHRTIIIARKQPTN